MASVFNFTVYLPAATLMFVFALTLVAKFQPYKYKRNDTVDITYLFITISGFRELKVHCQLTCNNNKYCLQMQIENVRFTEIYGIALLTVQPLLL